MEDKEGRKKGRKKERKMERRKGFLLMFMSLTDITTHESKAPFCANLRKLLTEI
jgi:hypothetical protein